MSDWRKDLLRSINAPVTPQNLRFLTTWQRWEGGHTKNNARFNWLNTTRDAPGAVRSINSVGVKAFDNYQNGVRATAQTLMNGRYDDIVAGLVGGDPYKANPSAGLQTWVSGRPDGNPGYAQKVLGGGAAPKAAPAVGRGPTGNPGLAAPRRPAFKLPDSLLWDVWGKLTPLFKQTFPDPKVGPASPGPALNPETDFGTTYSGKTLVLPTKWKSTHVTDGLSEEGFRTATDIMGAAGTPVGAPEGGKIVRWGSAQGGQAIWFQGDSGRMYWIGHIDNIAKPGSRVKRGQVIARISADHPRPHVHLDVRGK